MKNLEALENLNYLAISKRKLQQFSQLSIDERQASRAVVDAFRVESDSLSILEEHTLPHNYKFIGTFYKYILNECSTILIDLTKALKLNSLLKGQTFQKLINILCKQYQYKFIA